MCQRNLFCLASWVKKCRRELHFPQQTLSTAFQQSAANFWQRRLWLLKISILSLSLSRTGVFEPKMLFFYQNFIFRQEYFSTAQNFWRCLLPSGPRTTLLCGTQIHIAAHCGRPDATVRHMRLYSIITTYEDCDRYLYPVCSPVASIPIPAGRSLRAVKNKGRSFVKDVDQNFPLPIFNCLGNLHPQKTKLFLYFSLDN